MQHVALLRVRHYCGRDIIAGATLPWVYVGWRGRRGSGDDRVLWRVWGRPRWVASGGVVRCQPGVSQVSSSVNQVSIKCQSSVNQAPVSASAPLERSRQSRQRAVREPLKSRYLGGEGVQVVQPRDGVEREVLLPLAPLAPLAAPAAPAGCWGCWAEDALCLGQDL
jgi:hypothetical protein